MDRATTRVPTERGWGHGPSWGAVALVLLTLAVAAVVAGFDAALYAEIGGREGPERAYSCTPQEDGSCVDPTLIERQAAREPKLMSKLTSISSELGLAGLLLFVAGLASIGPATLARRRRRAGSTASQRFNRMAAFPALYRRVLREEVSPRPSPAAGPLTSECASDLERTTGLEPATPTLARWCSTN